MVILGIETTCDETAAALVERTEDAKGRILSNIVLSQVSEHAEFGGVVPEIAARAHVEALDAIIAKAMADAQMSFEALDGIAAAAGPGLIGGVIVGLTTAKAIALAHDKTAKLLGLGYPGGPLVEKEAGHGDPKRFALPRPMAGRQDANFSLSGLKTALRLEAEKIAPLSDQDVADLCASFQQAVVDVVMDRLRAGMRMFRDRLGTPTALVCAGGVAANQAIRKVLHRVAFEVGTTLVAPPPALCTDNGAMIAWAGAERLALGLTDPLDVAPRARWPLDQVTKAEATA